MLLADLVVAAWQHVVDTTEDPFKSDVRASPLARLIGVTPYTYREDLDRAKRNWRGDVIPRIEIVKNNIASLGKPRRAPRLPA